MPYPGGDTVDTPYRVVFIGSNNTTYDTWTDWGLIPTTPPTIPNPEAETNYVDVPGRTLGPVDASEFPFGHVQFKRVTGTWEFVFPVNEYYGYQVYTDGTKTKRSHLFNVISEAIHGKVMSVRLPTENPNYTYHGRFSVGLPSNPGNSRLSKITIGYDLDPEPVVSNTN